jgi:uncharacterized membrane protein
MTSQRNDLSISVLIFFLLIGSLFVHFFYSLIGIVAGGLLIVLSPILWNFTQKKDFSVKNVKFWIMLLLALFTFFNLISFYVYQEAHPIESTWNQIWGFIESGFFSIVAASILLPLLLFLFENIFKIREKDEEKLHKKQLEIVKENQKMWRNLIDLTGKVKYFENNNKKESINEILHKLDNFTLSVDEFLVALSDLVTQSELEKTSESPSLISSKNLENLLDPIRFLYYSTLSVANYIANNDPDVNKLKLSLNAIEEGLIYIHHATTGTILNDHFLDSNILEDRIKRYRFHSDYVKEYRKLIITNNIFLQTIPEDDKVKGLKDLRKHAKDLEKWRINNPKKEITSYEKLSEFREQYKTVQFELINHNLKSIIFSKEFIYHFADYLSYSVAINKILERASWQKEAKND